MSRIDHWKIYKKISRNLRVIGYIGLLLWLWFDMACYSKNDRNSGPAPASKPSWDAKCSSLSRGFGPRVPKISTVCHSMSPKKRVVSMGKSTINGNKWYIFHCHVSLPTNHRLSLLWGAMGVFKNWATTQIMACVKKGKDDLMIKIPSP